MRRLLLVCAALALLAGAFFASRPLALHHFEHGMLVLHGPGHRKPPVPYEEMQIQSGDRTLRAFFVPADGPGLLIFHGNGEAISGWVDALKLLHDAGIAAMVFDYSGFGASTGKPTLEHFREDGLAAWRTFRARLPPATRACAYGLSLGSGVLLDVAAQLDPRPDCFAVSGAFLSAREAAVALHRLPRWARFIVPDVLDNLDNAARLRAPLLIEHGTEDGLFPVEWASRLQAAHPGAQLAIVLGMKHADPVAHPSEASWGPVVQFIKSETTARR